MGSSIDMASRTIDQHQAGVIRDLLASSTRHVPRKKIAIISTPRSGSSFFCGGLSDSGLFGRASEWFHPGYIEAYAHVMNLSKVNFRDYLEFIMGRTTTANGVFSVNFHVGQYLRWKKRGIDLLDIGFDKCLHVYRKDKIAQAHSFAKAKITKQWGSKRKPVRNVPPAGLSNADVLSSLCDIAMQEDYFVNNLSRHVGLACCYEEFSESPACFDRVLEYCDIEKKVGTTFKSDLSVQRGASDKERVAAIKNYLGGIPTGL